MPAMQQDPTAPQNENGNEMSTDYIGPALGTRHLVFTEYHAPPNFIHASSAVVWCVLPPTHDATWHVMQKWALLCSAPVLALGGLDRSSIPAKINPPGRAVLVFDDTDSNRFGCLESGELP